VIISEGLAVQEGIRMPEAENQADRRAAMEKVVSTYEAPLLRYAVRLMNHSDAAQDVVQESLIRFFERWNDSMEPAPQVACWLYRTVHNCAVDYIRKESRRAMFLKQQGEASEPLCDPEVTKEQTESPEDIIARAMDALNLRERQLVVLKVLQEKSYKEIAEITGLSEGNVGYILHHAVKKMAAKVRRGTDNEE
jgi:RNA polymerase sigma factor (sigma-70 family)